MGYRYLKNYRRDDGSNGITFCDREEAEFIMLPINEYNGLKKAVRIVNDRALQQIDKSKADENGFRILRAGKSFYREGKGMVYMVTKETPYSIKMRLDEAWALIENKLREIYYWVDEFNLDDFVPESYQEKDMFDRMVGHLYDSDYPKMIKDWEDKEHRNREFLIDNSKKGRAVKNLMSAHEAMIISIAKVSANQAQGVYEVSYWCTKPI